MLTFKPTGKAPGVYIVEVDIPGPIAGVTTSTTAFVGPAKMGPKNTPTKITNWTQYVSQFGTVDPNNSSGPYFATGPVVYAPYAVRGFFDNGGAIMYFVRATNGAPASGFLNDRSANPLPTLSVQAGTIGTASGNIMVAVTDSSIAATTAATAQGTLIGPGATASTATVSPADAANFVPGDVIEIVDGATTERGTIASIVVGTGGTAALNLAGLLTNAHAAGVTIRIADLVPSQTTVRLASTGGIEPGTVLNFAQALNESVVVQSVSSSTGIVTLASGLQNTYTLAAHDPAVTVVSQEFTLSFGTITYPNLSMDPRHSRYVGSVVPTPGTPGAAVTVVNVAPPNPNTPPLNFPAAMAATRLNQLPGAQPGQDEDLAALGGPAGTSYYQAAIDSLLRLDDVNILCVPDRVDPAIQSYMISHCTTKQDRFAILDPQPGLLPTNVNTTQRQNLQSDKGYAAFYWPRIVISNPIGGTPLTIPPSGHLAGVYAATDDNPGVFKAPANAPILNALDLEFRVTDDEQGPLNDNQINCIRFFPGRGVVVFGARTLSLQTPWRYVSTRRLLIYIEQSLKQGTQFVVFQPNNQTLWYQVDQVVTAFLRGVWQSGALMGDTADDGFAVKVDAELNPPDQIALGILSIQVTVYPAPPAEYVVFYIIQQPGGPVITET